MHVADPGDLEHDPLGQLREEVRRGAERRDGREEEKTGGKKKKEMGQSKNGNGTGQELKWEYR
jgi:hypothetical protein